MSLLASVSRVSARFSLALAFSTGLAQAALLTVNSSAMVISGSQCTLAKAISNINIGSGAAYPECVNTGLAYGTSDTIEFNIPGATDPGCTGVNGVCTITVIGGNTSHVQIKKPVTIDGTTQPGSAVNTQAGMAYPNAQGLNTQIRIEIDGRLVSPGIGQGVEIQSTAANSILRGLAIFGFPTNNVTVSGYGSRIEGNFIGSRANGNVVVGNALNYNLAIINQATVGGFTADRRNLIGGLATNADIMVNWAGASSVIAGNLIGTDITGTGTGSYMGSPNHGIHLATIANSVGIDSNVIADQGGVDMLIGIRSLQDGRDMDAAFVRKG